MMVMLSMHIIIDFAVIFPNQLSQVSLKKLCTKTKQMTKKGIALFRLTLNSAHDIETSMVVLQLRYKYYSLCSGNFLKKCVYFVRQYF